ncbi:hypothetical protein [Rhizobium sp. CECT 9324]|uniref:hypothetical protein n=1 Tax=Rhizobium sp. CECT 9324 TaxID=2845820 RepID=UPI001E4ABACD|nr:hypothetical protein [Rhizobium sp. CECT 9324]CAH0339557.1 hypothetical protein RHI9324_01208 [Rhizobium sp. CECT 9324]
MPISQPKLDSDYSDRAIDCQQSIEGALLSIIEDAQGSGWNRPEAFDAIEELVRNFRLAYAEDPDPADDPSFND